MADELRPWRYYFGWWFSVSNTRSPGPLAPTYLGCRFYDSGTGSPSKEERNQRFVSDFRDTIWISYRRHFTGLAACKKIPARYHDYSCDSGWGCMIRFVSNMCERSVEQRRCCWQIV